MKNLQLYGNAHQQFWRCSTRGECPTGSEKGIECSEWAFPAYQRASRAARAGSGEGRTSLPSEHSRALQEYPQASPQSADAVAELLTSTRNT
ncbi:hypothetical protein M407DRAFT_246267 [Tulasnella calospora MUT 4182]|uniref:Uncharacterized protein n=1 Tax=Tulasnella calospora MUT 4182 TaxID=1051891 RepID=A0A0C3LCD4_9AGAM|nr:hypothetical protein M407DRAFT_246267 [Tulasnella calospora MUT 4182]